MSNILKSAALAKREGSSDKTYTIALIDEGGGFRVYAEWGRRGAAQQSGNKYEGADQSEAEKLFDKVLNEKLKGGYKPYDGLSFLSRMGGSAEAPKVLISPSAVREVIARVQPMKCGPVESIRSFLLNDQWAMEQKFDGKRRLLLRKGGVLTVTNSSGQQTNVLPELEEFVLRLPVDDFELDIEDEVVGGGAVALDLLGYKGQSIDRLGYDHRRSALEAFFKECRISDAQLRLACSTIGSSDKRKMVERLHEENAEGAILKDRLAVYYGGEAGREHWKKFKFVVTSTFIVEKVNAKRSVQLAVLNGLQRVAIGNCTIPPGVTVKANDLVEVSYLYARRGGCLIQPTNLRNRSDELSLDDESGRAAVQISHLKYKQGD
jgi:bifunctional non-homologous end joining protein LigD